METSTQRLTPRSASASGGADARHSVQHAFEPEWAALDDESLLDVRLCDLGLKLAGTWLGRPIAKLQRELVAQDIRCKPHFWLSDEWFTPDGVPGVAVPFYLAHPRLAELEKTQMLEVEGGTFEWCMRILRHEMGHVIDNAYRLHRRRKWSQLFGRNANPYPEYYHPKPYSKSYVLHLDYWYAQAHPAEDFAETFAVWLTPGSKWDVRFAGWPALKKLQYIDELMASVAGKPPPVVNRERVTPLRQMRTTLREHYRKKRAKYGDVHPDFYDRDLRRLFASTAGTGRGESAARFLRRVRNDLRRMVARWTGEYQYTIDQVLKEMITRCDALQLRLDRSPERTKLELSVLLTVQTMNYLHSGRHRVAL